jgi:CRP-like cAMP-binding protein
MSEATVREILSSIRFLEGVSEDDLQQIASVAQLQRYPVDRRLFRAGDRVGCIFLVVEGSVALELPVPGRGAKCVYTVGPGELLGWSPLFHPLPMTASARAVLPTQVVCIDAGQILALCHHDPQFGFAFMHRTALALAKRLEATRLQLLDIYRHELPAAIGESEGESA